MHRPQHNPGHVGTRRPPFDPADLPAVRAIAEAQLRRRGNRYGCPVCKAEQTSRTDRRPPLSVYEHAGAELWRCHACNEGGTAAALLAALRFGEVPPSGDPRWREVYEAAGSTPTPAAPRRPTIGPDAVSASALWGACRPLDACGWSEPAIPWLEKRRGLDGRTLAALDLCRLLPDVYPWPRWVPTLGLDRRAWLDVYRLAVPLFDALGQLVAVRFRAVDRRLAPAADGRSLEWVAPPGTRLDGRVDKSGRRYEALVADTYRDVVTLPKALSPIGVGHGSGLVMADPLGVALLRGERADDGVEWDGLIFVVEGEPDLWALATLPGRVDLTGGRPRAYAVLGIEAGSWTPVLAERIPPEASVRIWTDHDEAGEKYAGTIAASLAGRCEVSRVARPSEWVRDV